MILQLKRTPGLYLVGFMGSGKTTVGQLLSKRIGWRFVDLDADIEHAHGGSIQSIFADHGEPRFREIETAALRARVKDVERGHPHVLALGGGAFVQSANFELIRNNGVSIWLDAPFELIRRRVAADGTRPLAQDPVRFRELFEARRDQYAKANHHIAVDSENPEVTVDEILALNLFGK